MFLAAKEGHLDVCKLIVEDGDHPNDVTSSYKSNILHKAAESGSIECIQYFLGYNIDIMVSDN